MRIALVTDWFAPRQGGIESQILQLARRLRARGHDVQVLTTTPAGRAADVDGVPVTRLDVARMPLAGIAIDPRMLPVVRDALRQQFDVVHAHVSVVSPLGYAGAVIARRLQLPVVITFHSVLRAKRALLRLADSLLGVHRAPLRWTAVSELVAAQVRHALPAVPVAVLPNAVDHAFWRGGDRPVPDREGVATFVSAMRLHRKKRPRMLLRAFAGLAKDAGAQARLVIAGDGPELPSLRREARRQLDGRADAVTFLPWQDAHALRDLYARCHAFVLPSRRESFGLAALEARVAGLPVIAMRDAGCREFLEDGVDALLCDSDDGLATAMARMAADPVLRSRLALGGAGLERYDWAVVADAHERAYADAMRLASPGGSAVRA